MNGAALPMRAVVAFAAAFAGFGLAGELWLVAGGTVPAALLWAALLGGLALAARQRAPTPLTTAPRGLLALTLLVVAAGAALVAYDALATPSRHWDGVVAWQMKANALADRPTLAQPLFTDPAVYSHSRVEYPFLQPLAEALLQRSGIDGRWLFVVAYLALVAAIAAAGARAARGLGAKPLACAAAAAVTPMFLSSLGGSFASGYGDGLLAALVAATAFGVTGDRPGLVACGLIAMTLQKPEGIAYGGALVAALWLRDTGPMLRAALLGWGWGAATLAAQVATLTGQAAGRLAAMVTGIALLVGLVAAADRALRRRAAAGSARPALLAVAVALAVVAALATGRIEAARLHALPQVVVRLAADAWFGGRFGLTFFALPLVLWLAMRRGTARHMPLLLWFGFAAPVLCLPFLVLPLDDVAAHLKASGPRLLLHWTGAAWVWLAATWSAADGAAPVGTATVQPAP